MKSISSRKRSTHGVTPSSLVSLLILASLISPGCSTTTSPILAPDEARLMICKDGNDEQRASWGRMIKLARLRGDPYKLAEGVRWVGGHLWRCRHHE